MIALYNLHTFHATDLTDKQRSVIKQVYIEEGRKLWKEVLDEIKSNNEIDNETQSPNRKS
jgi:hypothetical protein